MANGHPFLPDRRHLYVVAGYPTSGKSSSLWKAARTGQPLFGGGRPSVIPPFESLRGIREDSETAAKLKAGLWITLADLPDLDSRPTLPPRLVLHLDLLVAYLRYRSGRVSLEASEFDVAFARLFSQPTLRSYEQYSVTTLHAPLVEVQHRWRHRYRDGVPSNCGALFAEKHRLITDDAVAARVFASAYDAWERCLAALARDGRLAACHEARSRLRSDLPMAVSPAPRSSA